MLGGWRSRQRSAPAGPTRHSRSSRLPASSCSNCWSSPSGRQTITSRAPWRFRVLGPAALARLKRRAGPEGAAKLDRCPTLVVVSCKLGGEPIQDEEDLHATAVAAYIVLLAAHARGLAGYWRTPGLLRERGG